MKIATLTHPQKLDTTEFPANVPLLMDDANAGTMLMFPGVRLAEWNTVEMPSESTRSLLIIRCGGYGDILFLQPAIRKLASQYPDMRISLAVADRFTEAAERMMAYVLTDWHIEPYPVDARRMDQFDCIVPLENLVEFGETALSMHVIDIFATRLGVALDDDEKRLRWIVWDEEYAMIDRRFPRIRRGDGATCRRVGIVLTASARCRSWPPGRIAELLTILRGKGVETCLIGMPGQSDVDGQGIVNSTAADPPLTFCESVALAASCDVVVSPDTAHTHYAAAAGAPVVALYGPFPWQLRTKYQPQTTAITGNAPCAPCHHHSRGYQFPPGMPCVEKQQCLAMAGISAERVAGKVISILRR